MSSAAEPTVTTAANGETGGRRRRHRHQRQKPFVARSGGTTTDGPVCFSDSGDDHRRQCPGGSHEECRLSAVDLASECLSEIDLESGELEMKKKKKEERECRICHLNLAGVKEEDECGLAIQLNCQCKGDLGIAHKQCAETWFRIKGNRTCEICGAIALNISEEHINEANNNREQINEAIDNRQSVAEAMTTPEVISETQYFRHSRRLMNFLLTCMLLAFIISWLFHFHVLP